MPKVAGAKLVVMNGNISRFVWCGLSIFSFLGVLIFPAQSVFASAIYTEPNPDTYKFFTQPTSGIGVNDLNTTYTYLNNNQPLGTSGTLYGILLYIPNRAYNFVNMSSGTNNSQNYGVMECNVAFTTSSGPNCSSGWNFYDFGSNKTMTALDNNYVEIDFPTHVTLNSGKYYSIDYQPYNSPTQDWPISVAGLGSGSCNIAAADTAHGQNDNCTEVYISGLKSIWAQLFDSGGANTASSTQKITSDISTNTTWNPGSVYIISGKVAIDPGVTLTVNSGVRIKFDTATTSSLTVNGTLNVNGSVLPTSGVVFTSLKDDHYAGDTNGDGTATTPAMGDWEGITVNTGGSASFAGTLILYAGMGTSSAAIYNNGGTVTFMGTSSDPTSNPNLVSSVSYNDYGLYNAAGTTTVTFADIGHNNYGAYVDGGSLTVTSTSTVQANAKYGIYNASANSVYAENDYWGGGSALPYSNPLSSSTPSGQGNPVSSNVDFSNPIASSTLHYIENGCAGSNDSCASVLNHGLRLDISGIIGSGYEPVLSYATSTWNALYTGTQGVNIALATSTVDLSIATTSDTSAAWIGNWDPNTAPNQVNLNVPYMAEVPESQREDTITHELGHALGLSHSFSGNIMSEEAQTSLGTQDVNDYKYLWY